MMMVTYLGDFPTVWRGVAFEPHLAVSVSDPVMIAKARTNPYFEVSDVQDEPVEAEVHDDLDGLRAMAEELGIQIDRRWGAERLQKAIDKALEG